MKINHVDKNGIIPHCWNSMSNLIEDRFSHGLLYSTWYVVLVEEHEKKKSRPSQTNSWQRGNLVETVWNDHRVLGSGFETPWVRERQSHGIWGDSVPKWPHGRLPNWTYSHWTTMWVRNDHDCIEPLRFGDLRVTAARVIIIIITFIFDPHNNPMR